MKPWEDLFESRILDRGFDIFQGRQIDSIEVDGNTLYARVQGTELYDVTISLSNGRPSQRAVL